MVHVTRPLATAQLGGVEGVDAWAMLPDGRLKLEMELEHNDARIAYIIGRDDETIKGGTLHE